MRQWRGREVWIIVGLAIGLTGCVMIPKNAYPVDWSAPLEGDRNACPKLSGTYWDWPARPAATGPHSSLDTFSLAKLLTEHQLDFDAGLGNVRLETQDDGTLRVDILDSRTDGLILTRTLRPGKDLTCKDGALVFGPFVVVSGEAFLVLSPNLGSRNVALRVTAEGDLIGVVTDYAAAAIGVLLPVIGMERYWFQWLRLDEPGGERPGT